MLRINASLCIDLEDIEISAMRAQGAGGQNVNKVSSAIHLRFDIVNSKIPEIYKARLLAMNDKRLTKEGVLIIKSQQHRTQEKNRQDALNRLREVILAAIKVEKPRRPTQPTKGSKVRRLEGKKQRGEIKNLRSQSSFD